MKLTYGSVRGVPGDRYPYRDQPVTPLRALHHPRRRVGPQFGIGVYPQRSRLLTDLKTTKGRVSGL